MKIIKYKQFQIHDKHINIKETSINVIIIIMPGGVTDRFIGNSITNEAFY